MNDLWIEWCSDTYSRAGNMIPYSKLSNLLKVLKSTGYRSVYYFKPEDAKVLKDNVSSKGMNNFEVGQDTLYIDLDDGDEQLPIAEKRLKALGLGYRVYHSGSKGFHILIPMTEFIWGKDLPYSQRKWIEDLDVGADLSLYQHGRIISLPGRIHKKTGKPKKFLYEVEGSKLDLPMLDKPEPLFNFATVKPEGSLELGLSNLTRSLTFSPTPGQRHILLYGVGCDLLRAGLSAQTVQELLQTVNSQWKNGKDPVEVDHALEGAIKTVFGSSMTGG